MTRRPSFSLRRVGALGVVFLICSAVPTLAQQRAAVRATPQQGRVTLDADVNEAIDVDDIPVLRVETSAAQIRFGDGRRGARGHRDEIDILVWSATPPAPLTERIRRELGVGVAFDPGGIDPTNPVPPGEVTAPAEVPLTSARLSARRTFLGNRAALELARPFHVDPQLDQILLPNPAGRYPGAGSRIELRMDGGELYLVDCAVSNQEDAKYVISGSATGSQSFNRVAGNHHLLFILQPEGDGWGSAKLGLQPTGGDLPDNSFVLHYCEVNRIE